jgi:hypothetical protein
MFLVLSGADYAQLRPETQADLLARFGQQTIAAEPLASPAPQETIPDAEGFNFEDVVDLTPAQVAAFVDGIHQQTVDGLRMFAEHGPIIDAHLLDGVGITNYSHFQGRVTKRTRTITGNKKACLFGWDEWKWSEDGKTLLSGRYAVTSTTYGSLRESFGLA